MLDVNDFLDAKEVFFDDATGIIKKAGPLEGWKATRETKPFATTIGLIKNTDYKSTAKLNARISAMRGQSKVIAAAFDDKNFGARVENTRKYSEQKAVPAMKGGYNLVANLVQFVFDDDWETNVSINRHLFVCLRLVLDTNLICLSFE